MFGKIVNALKAVYRAVRAAFSQIEKLGLDDELLALAGTYVKEAALMKATPAERREYAVAKISEKVPNVPERVIRVGIELALDGLKKAAQKLDEPDPKP